MSAAVGFFCKDLKNEFKIAVVSKASVFVPPKFYCMYLVVRHTLLLTAFSVWVFLGFFCVCFSLAFIKFIPKNLLVYIIIFHPHNFPWFSETLSYRTFFASGSLVTAGSITYTHATLTSSNSITQLQSENINSIYNYKVDDCFQVYLYISIFICCFHIQE